MKNKIAIASAFIAASSFSTAEIVVNDFLSFEGFIDMSYVTSDAEVDSFGSETDNEFEIDQVEISWLFDFDVVTAQIDLAYEGSDGDQDSVVEQAFATYHMGNGSSLTAGRMASQLGFEAFEPTGLYQYSFAYNTEGALGDFAGVSSISFLPGYYEAIKYTYESDNTYFGLVLADGIWGGDGRLGGDDDNIFDDFDSNFGLEAAFSIFMDNGISYFIGAAYEDADSAAGDDGDTWLVNSYVTFETGAWLFAAELNVGESDGDPYFGFSPDTEHMSALLMANFAYSDQASITGRLSYASVDSDFYEIDFLKYTLAHGYAFTDNLFLVTEVSYIDGSEDQFIDADFDELSAAVELIFSF